MDVTVAHSAVRGTARAPPSKSYTHRSILAAGYSAGALVYDPLVSADTRATMDAVEAFGGTVNPHDGNLDVVGFDGVSTVPEDVVDCYNSGTTMRLVAGTAAITNGTTVLTGDSSLRSRPQQPLLAAIEDLGGRAESTRRNGQAPLVITGPIHGGKVSIPGDVSSQFISSLLMAGALTDRGIEIELETELKSAPYVDITIEVLQDFRIAVSRTQNGFSVPGGQSYEPYGGNYHVPGDFSSISYLLAAGALAADSKVHVEGAFPSAQGDTAIVDIVERMGGVVDWDRENGVLTTQKSALEGIDIDVGDTPDLLPTIAVLGSVADGTTRLINCEHVRYKETDRVAAMATELQKMGAVVEEEQDELVIVGENTSLTGTSVRGYDDHRIIMSLAIAGLVAEGMTTIRGAEHVDVSFPSFFEVLSELGADVRR